MAHYALIDENNIVVNVITGKNETDLVDDTEMDWEKYYGESTGYLCKRTSYNTRGGVHVNGGTPLRKNYAGVGYIFDPIRDAFYLPQPYPSWMLNEDTCLWEPPVPCPNDVPRVWNEETLSWDSV